MKRFFIFAVIIFPWLFTIWMSMNDWQIGMRQSFIGLANFRDPGRLGLLRLLILPFTRRHP